MKSQLTHSYLETLAIGLLTLILLALMTPGCGEMRAKEEVSEAYIEEKLPVLLTRNAQIGTEEERTHMQDTYRKLVQEIQQQPNEIKPRIQLVQLFMLEARATGEHGHYYPAALSVLDGILARDLNEGDRFYALFLKASVNLSLHQFDVARDLAEEAIRLNPHNAQVHGALVDAYVEMGEYEKAVQTGDKMVSLRPDLRSYSRVSYLRELHGEVEGAIEAMKQATTAGYPGYEETAWCRLTLGELYETYGDLDQAESQYQQILAERENYPFAIAARARIANKKGNTEEAESLLKEACEIIPEVSFYQDLAALYQANGREAEAEKLAEEILAMLADDEAAGHKMGLTYAEVYLNLLHQPEKALTYVVEEYEMRPENIEVNERLAELYYHLENWEMASKHIQKALRTGSADPGLTCLAGLIALKNDQSDAGKQLIRQALDRNPYLDAAWVTEAKQSL